MPFKYIFCLLISIQLYSQTDKNEELQNFINHYSSINNIEKQILHLDSIRLNTKNLDTLFFCNFRLGRIYYKKNKFNLAQHNYFESLKIAKQINRPNLDLVYFQLGNLFLKLAKSDSSILFYNKSLKISKIKHDTIKISRMYSNIARVYFVEKKYPSAIFFFKKAIYYGKKSNRNLCTTYNNFGSLYLELKKTDSAIYYYNKSLMIAINNKNQKKELRAHINLALTYFETPKTYNKAYNILIYSEKLAKEIKAHKFLYYIRFHLGNYFDLTSKPKEAIEYYNLALNSEYAKIDYLKQIEVLEVVANYYKKNNNYKKAYQFQKKYYKLKDSIYSLAKNKVLNEIKTKYEVAEKDNKITLLTKEKEIERSRKKTILITAISLLLLLMVLTYFLRNKIKTQKIIQQKEHLLFTQELKTKKAHSHIEGQEQERNRLAKELHDGLGGQIAGIKSLLQTINPDNLLKKQSELEQHLTYAIKNLRNISHDLSGNFLKDKDFNFLIQQLVKQSFDSKNIQFEIAIFPSQKINKLSERYKLNIYRILQESFQNISKHAKASFVSISIVISEDINILIEDNGIGFNSNKKTNGIGLQNIKDRIQSLNGNIYFDSVINKGTTLNINIPYND